VHARTLVIALAVVCAALGADAVAVDVQLARVHSWAFAIGAGDLSGDVAARYAPFDLVVVDGQEATRRQVAELQGRDRIVLGYLDIGTIEPGRPWFSRARRYRLDFWPDWGEWFADVSRPGYRRLMLRGVAEPMLAKGFDGLFLDNVDMISGHPRQAAGMGSLVGALATLVHERRGRRGLLFAQNGEDVVGPMLRYLDGWNREDVTWTYDFGRHRYLPQPPAVTRQALEALHRIHRAGLLVTATDYVPSGNRAAVAEAVRNACSAGALPYVSDIDLRRIPRAGLRCPGGYP
jgi:uncharacterized protein (TIGR01370 family)